MECLRIVNFYFNSFVAYEIGKNMNLNKMTIKKLNTSKTPIVKINKSLNKLADKVLFPEKLEEANNMLKTVRLPQKKSQRN